MLIFIVFQLCYRILPREGPKNQVGFELNGTHQLLVYVDNMNLLGHNINTIKKNAEAVIDASNEVGPEVKTEETKYISMSCHHNAGKNPEHKDR
jgi:hypothetical protein